MVVDVVVLHVGEALSEISSENDGEEVTVETNCEEESETVRESTQQVDECVDESDAMVPLEARESLLVAEMDSVSEASRWESD